MPIATTKTVVQSSYVDTSDTPQMDVPVFALLIGPAITTDGVIERQTYTKTDINGLWSLSLYPNSLFANSGSYYIISIGTKEVYNVVVPVSANPVQLTSLSGLVTPSTLVEQYYGNLTLQGNLNVQGNVTVNGNVTYGTSLQQNLLNLNGPATFLHDLIITGNLTVTGSIYTTGSLSATTISGA